MPRTPVLQAATLVRSNLVPPFLKHSLLIGFRIQQNVELVWRQFDIMSNEHSWLQCLDLCVSQTGDD